MQGGPILFWRGWGKGTQIFVMGGVSIFAAPFVWNTVYRSCDSPGEKPAPARVVPVRNPPILVVFPARDRRFWWSFRRETVDFFWAVL